MWSFKALLRAGLFLVLAVVVFSRPVGVVVGASAFWFCFDPFLVFVLVFSAPFYSLQFTGLLGLQFTVYSLYSTSAGSSKCDALAASGAPDSYMSH